MAVFRDRLDAALQLAVRLRHLRGQHPLVLAIPRGALPMGRVIAAELDGELDVVLVRKIGAPDNPEYAIGAVSESGTPALGPHARARYGADYVEAETRRQLDVLHERRRRYTPLRPPIDPAGRVVVVVDDGSATGATMLTALRDVAARRPARLVAALGVAPPDVVKDLQQIADEVVCLHTPRFFNAVGAFFADFAQVSDETVEAILADSATSTDGGSRH